ncbi:MAG: dipeptide ABC transporter ATP-binding protein [Alphaproteobacteria bacterium]|nr:dipeptide ABC transporter ATP-binding protein [Alphaproteobacteria bacterium]
MNGTGETILTVDDVRVHFPVPQGLFAPPLPLKAVDGVSFDIKAGETLGIVGESGCGKSTLGRAILQLIKPTSGRIIWMGEDIAGISDRKMRPKRRDLQIIFQDPLASLNPRMTVGDIIAEPLDSFFPRMKREERKAKVKDIMAKVGLLPEMINRYPHEFSGGQAQRIGIARAMVLRPKLIVCDEPVSSLDVSIRAQIVNLLSDLQKEFGLSLVFISHDLSVIRHVSHRILVLYLGKIMELATSDLLNKRPRHPYTEALLSAAPIPDPEIEKAKKRIVIGEDLPSPINPPSGCVFRTRCPKAQERCAIEFPFLEAREAVDGSLTACHFPNPA